MTRVIVYNVVNVAAIGRMSYLRMPIISTTIRIPGGKTYMRSPPCAGVLIVTGSTVSLVTTAPAAVNVHQIRNMHW